MTDETLPPLPEAEVVHFELGTPIGFTADQMHAYGRLCADAAIERCAVLVESNANVCGMMWRDLLQSNAVALRAMKGKP